MTLLLELNDLGVRCFQDGKLLCQSAGVAVMDLGQREPLFGSAAWRESRIKPLHTHTQFWSQLNIEPLLIQHPLVRHHGDLAYLHLRHIEQQLPVAFAGQDVVFALPAATPRATLSLLLGIANQCGLNTLSFVDTALAALLHRAPPAVVTHVEMSLHHCVVTELQLSDNVLQSTRSEVLSEQGWFTLHTQLLNYFSELFIQQCRFNPRHQASSEQILFDAIPHWLRQSAALERDGITTFHCELEHNRVQVHIGPLRQFVQSVWQPLHRRLAQAGPLYLGDRLAECLPLLSLGADTVALDVEQLAADLALLTDSLSRQPAGVRFINSLPCLSSPSAGTAARAPATHLLYRHTVWPLQGEYSMTLQRQLIRGACEPALLSVQQEQIRAHQGQLLLNDVAMGPAVDTRSLKPGDRLSLSSGDVCVTLVRVEA